MSTLRHTSISRRRLLSVAATGSAGLAAAALIGCSSTSREAPAEAPRPAAGTAAPAAPAGAAGAAPEAMQPKSGGTLKYSVSADVETLDRYRGQAPAGWSLPNNFTLSRLLQFENGHGKPASGKIIGDLAKSWEQPDPQTIVIKLDPAAKFDARPPTNGRQVNAEDVVQSWKRYAKEAAERTQLSNAANKSASIVDIEAVDAGTVRVKLAFPDSLAFSGLAGSSGIRIQSVEGISGKFDQAKEIRGSGPFTLESYRSGVGFSFKKNPQWHGGEGGKKPYLDQVEVSIIPDQAQAEVQFRSKNLHMRAVSQENIPTFAKELKDTKVITATPATGGPLLGLSWADGQPWHDVRVRRGLSMMMDRDRMVDVFFDPKSYESVGVKLNTYWNTPLAAGWGQFWLDPKGKDFGPAAQYLKHNAAEGAKLIAAAGYSKDKPLEFDVIYPGLKYGRDWPTRVDTFQAMAAEAGVKMRQTSIDYTDYVAHYWRGGAKFEGRNQKNVVQFPPGGAAGITALEWLISYFTPKGVSTAVADKWPQTDEMIKKARQTPDFEAQKAIIWDIQRYIVDNMLVVPVGPITEAVDLVWKQLRGPGEIQQWPGGLPGEFEYSDFWFEGPIA